ncbi:MAG: glycosyltransferase [Elusimicrobiota bacterium]
MPRLFGNVLIVVPLHNPDLHWSHVDGLKDFCAETFLLEYFTSIKERGIRGTQARIEEMIGEKRIEVVILTLFADSFQFPLEFFARLRRKVKVVFMNMDDENYFDVHGKFYGQTADAVITSDRFAVAAYARIGVPAVLYLAQYSRKIYHPVEVPRDIDVSFIGDCAKCDRAEFLRFLADNGIAVESFGYGSRNGYVEYADISRVMSRTKVNLNFTKMVTPEFLREDDPLHVRVRQNKGHAIEAALARSFCLSEYAPSLPFIFEIGKEIDWFDDRRSLLERVRYYLSHDSEREAMAANAYARAREEYLQEAGFPRMLGELHEMLQGDAPHRISQPPTVLKNARFKARQTSAWFVCWLAALRRGQWRIAMGLLPDFLRYGPWILLCGLSGGARRAFDLYRAKRGG